MTAIVCDICKKAVPAARRDINYFTLLDKDVCEACHDELRDVTKAQMRAKPPYHFKDYQNNLARNLMGMVAGR